MSNNDTRHFETGAKRSGDADNERYDLISPIGLRRLAETYAEGAAKYGDRNWENGFPASVIFNHAVRHLNLWLAGDDHEDHLAHAAWNLFALMHFEETRSDLFDIPSREDLETDLNELLSNQSQCGQERNCGRCEHRACDAENYCEVHNDACDGVQRVYFCPGCSRRLAICEWIQCDDPNAVLTTCRREASMFGIAKSHVPMYRIVQFGDPVEIAAVRKLGSREISLLEPEGFALLMARLNECRHCEEIDIDETDFELQDD